MIWKSTPYDSISTSSGVMPWYTGHSATCSLTHRHGESRRREAGQTIVDSGGRSAWGGNGQNRWIKGGGHG